MIQLIFDEDNFALVVALIAVMVIFGAFTARARARLVPKALLAACSRAGGGCRAPSGWSSPSGIFEPTPRYLVPSGAW